MATCRLCGAWCHGNITCPMCRSMMPISADTRIALRLCEVGFPLGTQWGSPEAANIRSVNRHLRKARHR